MHKTPDGLVENSSFNTEISQAQQELFLPPFPPEETSQDFSFDQVLSARVICDEAVNSARKNKVTLVQAPAGYGKTDLLRRVYNNFSAQRIWISFESLDNEPQHLVDKLVAGLNFCGIAISTYEHEILHEVNAEQVASAIAKSLPTDQRVLVFFLGLDSIHERFGLKLVEALVRSSPPAVHFLLAMESSTEVDLSALAMRNQVRYILRDALSFGELELTELIGPFSEGEKSKEEFTRTLETLTELTDGWAVAIHWAFRLLNQAEPLSRINKLLNEGVKDLDRYLEFSAIKDLDDAHLEWLCALALMDRFTLQQAVHILQDDNTESLPGFLRGFAFVFEEYDQGETWFRFHRPLRTYLQKLCRQKKTSEQITALKIKAAQWYFDHNWIEIAIDLILQCERSDLGAQWLLRYAEIAKKKGNHGQLLHWLQQLPPDELSKHPALQAAYVLCLMLTKRFIQSDSTTTGLANLIASDVMDQQRIDRNVPLLSMATLALKDEINGLGEGITQWLATWERNPDYMSVTDYNLEMGLAKQIKGFCCKCESDFEEGDRAFNQSRKHFEAYSSDYGIAWTETLHTVLLAKQGLYFEAQIKARDGLEFIRRHLHSGIDIHYMLSTLLSAMYFECGDWEKAKEFFPENFNSVVTFGFADILIAGYETQTKLMVWEGENDSVVDLLKANIKQAESEGIVRVVYALVNQLIVLLIRFQRIDEARQYAERYLEFTDEETKGTGQKSSLRQSLTRVATIHLLVEDGEYLQAATAVDQAIEYLQRQKRYYSLVEAFCLRASIHHQMGDQESAKEVLRKALSIAAVRNYVMVFDQNRQIMWDLLNELRKEGFEPRVRKFFNRLKQIVFATMEKEKGGHDELTKKERKVIQAAESGDTTLQLSQQFNISQGTLKWHLHNIYGKLGVKNRTQAIKKAKELGYISE